jgi:nucleoid DNA-binding protein
MKQNQKISIKFYSDEVARQSGLDKKDVDMVIDCLTEVVRREVGRGVRVNFLGLGIFRKHLRKGRRIPHPITQAPMRFDDIQVVKFRPSSKFTRAVRL